MIPEDYKTKEGLLLKPNFFENLESKVEIKISQTIRNKLKKAIEDYENSAIIYIKIFVDIDSKEKPW